MKLRVDTDVIAFKKAKKLCNELTGGINTSVANCIDDARAPCDKPSEDDLWQFVDNLKCCHAATLGFEWNNFEMGHNGKPLNGEKACAC
eukprot:12686506-Ditylum_brightwellii.AAC.1